MLRFMYFPLYYYLYKKQIYIDIKKYATLKENQLTTLDNFWDYLQLSVLKILILYLNPYLNPLKVFVYNA